MKTKQTVFNTALASKRYLALTRLMPGEYADFSNGVTTGVVEISPEVAQTILDRFQPLNEDGTVRNRPKTESNIESLQTAINAGEMPIRWESVIFDNKMKLIDGQHTMHAVVRSGKTIRAMVLIGPPNKDFEKIGQGLPRNGATVFQIHQEKTDAVSLAASVKTLYTFLLTGRIETPTNKTLLRGNQALYKFYQKYPDLKQSVNFMTEKVHARRISKLKGRLPTLHYLFSKFDRELADEFFEALDCDDAKIGLLSDRVRPALELRTRLIKALTDSRMRLTTKEAICLTIKVWNQCATGETRRVFYSPREGFPKIYGISYDDQTGRPILDTNSLSTGTSEAELIADEVAA